MLLGHTIVAMVGEKIARVRCNTCQGQHAYRALPPGTRAAVGARGPAAPRAPREKAEVRAFETLFADRDPADARAYAPRERFAEGDVLAHPTFGLGLVKNARQDKIDVIFKMGEKTLVHGLGGARQPVTFQKPAQRETAGGGAAADKPPPGEPKGMHAVRAAPPTERPSVAAEAEGAGD